MHCKILDPYMHFEIKEIRTTNSNQVSFSRSALSPIVHEITGIECRVHGEWQVPLLIEFWTNDTALWW